MDAVIFEVSGPERAYGDWAIRYPGKEHVTIYFSNLDYACLYLAANPGHDDLRVKFKADLD